MDNTYTIAWCDMEGMYGMDIVQASNCYEALATIFPDGKYDVTAIPCADKLLAIALFEGEGYSVKVSRQE